MKRRTFLGHGLAGLAALMARPIVGCAGDDEGATSPLGADAGDDTRAEPSADAGLAEDVGTHVDAAEAAVADAGADADAADADADAGDPLRSNLEAIGPLGAPDVNGVRLPAGFTARIVARTGEAPVAGKPYVWHPSPDGGATFATEDGGFIYVSNRETIPGGAGAIRFDAQGAAVDAYAVLSGTTMNCAGGKTPWGTWLSCEEIAQGRVHECDPTGAAPGVARPALGVFKHEAVAVDPATRRLYLTEDEPDGRLYRFTPASVDAGRADLSSGALDVAEVMPDGSVVWHPVPDPGGPTPTRTQVAASTAFKGGEGIACFAGHVYFSTKGDDRVWAYDVQAEKMTLLYDAATAATPILTGVDNVTVTFSGDVLVAEDGGDMQLVAILPDGTLKPLLQIVDHDGSEIAGPAFDPSGKRLYFSSQRGKDGAGITFEVSGPFHVGAS